MKNSLLKIDLSIRYRFLLMIEAQQVFDRGFAQRKDWSLDRFTVTSFTFIFMGFDFEPCFILFFDTCYL